MNKFEQVSSDGHQMSVTGVGYPDPMSGGGGRVSKPHVWRVPFDLSNDLDTLPFRRGQIHPSFPKLRLRAVINRVQPVVTQSVVEIIYSK